MSTLTAPPPNVPALLTQTLDEFRFVAFLLCLLTLFPAMPAAESQTVRPNIIVILTDDMGYSDIGCYGGEINTPTLDSLAAGGIRFTQFYNTARCCPTRASLLTGLHPHQAGMGHMVEERNLPGYAGELLPSCVTIAEALKTAGYATYGVGKWHVTKHLTDSDRRDNYPTRRGFDRYYGIITGATNFFEPATLIRDETPISPMNDVEYKPDEYYFTTAISDYAVRYLNEHAQSKADQPFFMYIAHTAAHWPMQALPKDIAKYEGRYDLGYDPIRQARFERMRNMELIDERWLLTPKTDEWNSVRNKQWEAKCMEVYAAMIDCMDQGVGSVVKALKENGQYENTVIIYLHDNGACAETPGRQARRDYPERVDKPVFEPYPQEHIVHRREDERRTRDGFPIIMGDRVMPGPKDTFIAYGRGWANVSNTPFREFKHWIHEGGIATPLIIHAPSLISEPMKGQYYGEYGQLVDIMATCLDIAGVKYPEKRNGIDVTPLQGTSLKPAFTGETLARKIPLFWEHEGNRAIRDGKWKLVAKGPTAPWELYDMDADRSEMNDVAGEHREIAEKMAAQWENWAKDANVFPWPWAQYQRRFRAQSSQDAPVGLVFEMLFENEPLKDSSKAVNSFTVEGAARTPQLTNGVFDGRTWITIEKTAAFDCANVAWRVEAEITPDEQNGVIMSQGGSRHGYSLYIQDGKPGFAVRLDGNHHFIAGQEPIKGNTQLSGSLTSAKKLVLQVNGKIVAEGNVPGFIQDMPIDPPIIGNDLGGTVAATALPAFKGKIKRVAIYRGDVTPEAQPLTRANESPRPNIVLILADDVGFSDLGCYVGEVKTPVLDKLAAGGVRFTQFYNTTRCCPSRASINTGLYPHQAGLGHMDARSERRGYEGYLTDRCVTLAEVLKAAGYRTYMVGKWHMNHESGPIDRGFDDYYGLLRGHSASFFDPVANGRRLPAGRPLRSYPQGQYYATDAFTDYALDFLAESRKPNEKGERPPFFLYIAHTAPHFPLHAPKEEIAKYADTYLKGWDMIRDERFAKQNQLGLLDDAVRLSPRSVVPKNWVNVQTGWADKENPAWDTLDADRRVDLARRMAIFAAMIDRMDQNIGRVVADLDKNGELDNTLIMFLSDNGACAEWDPWGFDIDSGPRNVVHKGAELERMGGPGTYHSTGSGWANASNTPWRLYKHYIHEGGIRTPMIVHWSQGITRKGELEKSVGHIIDFMPTVVELAGATYPAEWKDKPIIPMEGRSLVKAFAGTQNEPRTLYWEHEGNRGMREGDMKLVWLGEKKEWELYDLKTDPVELNDLAGRQPEVVKRMTEAWEVWARRAFVVDAPLDTERQEN